jgi:3-phosphoshikimate 1-carboxyvinyltransferase
MAVHGGTALEGAECDSSGDHRIAMTMGVAGLLSRGTTTVTGAEAAGVSYPGFWDALEGLASSERA